MKRTGLFLLISVALFFLPVNYFIIHKDHLSGEKDSTAVINITVVGDLMCHSVQFNYARVTPDSFDFTPVFRFVKPIISTSDFAFGNFETVTAGKKEEYSGYPFFNSPDQYVFAIADAGFDLMTTANNHALDRGENGVLRTIDIISVNKMGYNGTFKNQRDRDSVRIYNIKGIRAAFLAYSYGTNGNLIPRGKNYLINIIDTAIIKNDLAAAKILKPDIIIVHYHFGEEYLRKPSKQQTELVRWTAKSGADIIIGGHPHVIQPYEFIASSGNKTDSSFVIYSMGNFISNQQKRYTDAGLLLQLFIEKNFTSGKISFKKINFTPTWIFKGNTGRKNEYVIIPENQDPGFSLNQTARNRMLQAFQDTHILLMEDTLTFGKLKQ